MPFEIPNGVTAAFTDQAQLDNVDLDILVSAHAMMMVPPS